MESGHLQIAINVGSALVILTSIVASITIFIRITIEDRANRLKEAHDHEGGNFGDDA
jgi:hypothetical protein